MSLAKKYGTTQEYKYVLWMPTTILTQITEFLMDVKADVWGLKAQRSQQQQTKTEHPTPYISQQLAGVMNARVNYSFPKHQRLNLDFLQETLKACEIKEMCIEELSVSILRKDLGLTKGEGQSPRVIATFQSALGITVNGTGDSTFLKMLEEYNEQFARLGFKYSCLDLVSLVDSKLWAQGKQIGYDIGEMVEPLQKIRQSIDPNKKLTKIRSYRKESGEKWTLVSSSID